MNGSWISKPYAFFLGFLVLALLANSVFFADSLGGDEKDYLAFAEKMPTPIGGMVAVQKKIEYPTFAQNARIEGKVFVLAFVDERGNVNDVKVVKGIGGGCDEEVIDAVKSSKFSPGSNKGVPVKVKLSLAFSFKL